MGDIIQKGTSQTEGIATSLIWDCMSIKTVARTREMVQALKVLVGFAAVLGLVPGTYIRWLITAYNSSSKGTKALFWPLWALHTRGVNRNKQTHKNKSKDFF